MVEKRRRWRGRKEMDKKRRWTKKRDGQQKDKRRST